MMHGSKAAIVAIVLAVAALCIGGGAHGADTVSSPGTQPTTLPGVDEHWRGVLGRLGSDSFAEREAAQKELESLGYKQMDLLKQLAGSATDAEAKSRVANRIRQIEEELMYSPPPISLEVQNATVDDLSEALGKAMGVRFEAWQPNGNGGRRADGWTLSVKDKPFWEVIGELQKQSGLAFQESNGALRLHQQQPGLHVRKVFGGLCVYPQSITRIRTVNWQAEAGGQEPEQFIMGLMGVLDSRVVISSSMGLELNKVVDDLGNVLLDHPPANGVRWSLGGYSEHLWNQGFGLVIPQKLGTKIVSAQGRLRLLVPLATEKVEVMDMDKKLNTAFTVGGRTVTFQQFAPLPDNNTVQFNMQASRPPRAARGAEPDVASAPVTVSFIDSKGKYIWGQTFQGDAGGSFGGQFVPPLKVVLSVPTKVKEVTIPFEMKDLPLP